jgi:S1-C subfamily serine protease
MAGRHLVAALAAVVMAAGSARAQAAPAAGGAMTVRGTGRALVEALGFNYAAQVVMSPDGTPRAADYPVIGVVVEGSPAHTAGVEKGDAILAVNGRDGREPALFRKREPGERYVLRLRRGGEVREVEVVAAPLPAGAR